MKLFLPYLVTVAVFAMSTLGVSGADANRPNILWFVVDDMSANFSCYGEKTIQTPNVDRLAREGTKFTRAFVTAPVCSPCRSALITGMYQTSIGSHHHRSGRGKEKIRLPEGVEPVPALFQRAGYYTCIGEGLVKPSAKARLGKTDYNFEWDQNIYNGPDWSGRAEGQPFFMQVQLDGGKLRAETPAQGRALAEKARAAFGSSVKPEEVTLPPYYPSDPVLLEDWAAYLDSVRLTDKHVGDVMARLESEGLLTNTLVIFITDHGISHARGKQFLYDEGTHIPFVVRGPGIAKDAVRDDLIEHIDMAAISLAAAGIEIPKTMQARDVFAKEYQPRDVVFAARDRCDETVERIRSVRTDRWLYIRNFHPERPHLQPNAYKDGKAIVIRLRELHAVGQLPELTEKLLFATTRPKEELYEWTEDRWQVKNLAGDTAYSDTLALLRGRLDRWIAYTQDRGAETAEMWESDMAVYLGSMKKSPEQVEVITRNIEQMRKWAAEGK